jgi:hypothetical protein
LEAWIEKQAANPRNSITNESSNEELIWKAHVLDAQRFEGTDEQYCELHGLKLRQLKQYRRKFGATRTYRPRKPKAFVKVECTNPLK